MHTVDMFMLTICKGMLNVIQVNLKLLQCSPEWPVSRDVLTSPSPPYPLLLTRLQHPVVVASLQTLQHPSAAGVTAKSCKRNRSSHVRL